MNRLQPEDIAKLSREEKITLLDALMDSFDPPETDMPPLSSTQLEELERRRSRLGQDQASALPLDEVITRLSKHLP